MGNQVKNQAVRKSVIFGLEVRSSIHLSYRRFSFLELPFALCAFLIWSGRADLNGRPPAPKAGALTRLRYAPPLFRSDIDNISCLIRQPPSLLLLRKVSQYFSHFSQGLSSMADSVLLFNRDLGHGLSIMREDEKRIISKPSLAHLFKSNSPPADPFCHCLSSVSGSKGHDAFKSRSSFRGWNPLHLPQ